MAPARIDAKDSKSNPGETGIIDSHETASPATPRKSSTSIRTGVAKLGTEEAIQASSADKRVETPPTRRRRLIDALVAEETGNSSSDPGPNAGKVDLVSNSERLHAREDRPSFRKEAHLRRTGSDSSALERRKIKVTYSQSRSFLQSSQESNTAEAADYPPLMADIDDAPLRPPSPVVDEYDDVDDDLKTKVAIRSVHELRRAGANHRSSDEVDDLLSRIGTPGSLASTMRRNGLCELADKLQKKEFMNQFRDHASRDNIAKGISDEKDAISGFLLVAILVIFLSSNPAPHLLHQLAENQVGLLLNSLLEIQEDVTGFAAQKSANMSRASRSTLASVKSRLLGMDLWHGCKMLHLSPRTISLQLLYMLIRLLDPHDAQTVLDDASTNISKLRSYFAREDCRDDIDYVLLICILEAQSSTAGAADGSATKVRQEMSDIAAFLQRALDCWPRSHNNIDATLLKLAINTTNNEARAAALQNNQLLSSLARGITSGFSAVQSAIQKSAFESSIYDELVLILGITINILEHCSDARSSIHAEEIDKLVGAWSESGQSIKKDDSVETSKLGIAYSYLAIILGYLYLGHAELPLPSGLLPAIQHFITINKTVNNKTAELEHLVYSLRRLR
ncbi:hypothetical protein BBK36DRAFT_1182421 [Trichoderma citrinoviride]|uniref:Wings apart-like protein C-terminal domain-containing protein n=1 Tax=Trichoderma citrinoviride TaxID=58853 RepID=A0A2T4B2N6_9HYPO|nr:hypothetical protein BBK36DRAFT_1182421 [Trichoderma citrinoviride]PTB63586.1 hypothetical protein BBK36DRAFT_1182421 [Trichoderma citrinoviride]